MAFFVLSLIFRVLSRGCQRSYLDLCLLVRTFEMNHDKDTYIGYVEMAVGVGAILGPAIASFLYDFVGYVGTFVFFSGVVFVGIILSKIRIPNTLNERTADKTITQLDNDQTTETEKQSLKQIESEGKVYSELKYIDSFKDSESFILLLTACFSVVFTLYIEAILAIQLYKIYGVQQNLVGLFFLSASFLYVIGAPLASWLAKYIHKRYIILIALIIMVFQSFLEGPSQILGMPQSLLMVSIGVSLLGFGLSLAQVPLLSELIEVLEKKNRYYSNQISDRSSSLFNSMFNLGNLIAPIVASVINDMYGYVFTCDFMMIIATIYCMLFYFTLIFGRKLD
ncbi:permeases of the major facilitator superfamily [Stylonychia lemnae]|uniref:Permeases of the major facilitator superfamily n=1 Tax=Stylonychia lemnae TaxID=5949 RepID=A0A078A1K4_STYLE|nr:permeases of the major facilitator superfamily [Stylonychia lemnae]|eukprot:CDW75990.1 permeases of the major facilitator superfamily [Stylonychia lemnae]